MLKKILSTLIGKFGYELRRRKPKANFQRNDQMIAALARCATIGINPMTVIDVGAAAGSWSLGAVEIWSSSNYLLFEPLSERKTELENLSLARNNFQFVNAAAGNLKTQVQFLVSSDLDGSGVASAHTPKEYIRLVDVVRLDEEVRGRDLKGPYMIKLDTHGFEVPILEGCEKILDEVVAFIIESYGFHIADNSLLFWEMCQHMDRSGFRLLNIVDIMLRPKDGAFWQCDAFFIRKDHFIFSNNSYK